MPDPFVLMVAGPNGSGKTTLTRFLRRQGIDFGDYINPDDIAAELSGSYDSRVAQALALADRRRHDCIARRQSFSFETVMSHPSRVELLERAKAAGFFVQLFFVGIDDPRTNIERVALRVSQGGHDVPKDRIVARWGRSMSLLAEAIAKSDRAFVFDNSATGQTAFPPRLVFRKTNVTTLRSDNASGPDPRFRVFPPTPDWVKHYVLRPLALDKHLRFNNL